MQFIDHLRRNKGMYMALFMTFGVAIIISLYEITNSILPGWVITIWVIGILLFPFIVPLDQDSIENMEKGGSRC
jgi:hypothetical protein